MAGRENIIEDGKYFREQLGNNRGFLITYETSTEESAEAGEFAEHGYDDYHNCEPDELDAQDGFTAVSLAIEYLKDKGAFQPSNGSFNVRTWYTTGSDTNFQTGEETTYSYHPENFTPAEEEAIFKGVTGK
jgi:hypothetical protein